MASITIAEFLTDLSGLKACSPEEAMALVQVGRESQSGGNVDSNNDGDDVIKDTNEFVNLYMEIGQKKGLEGLEELRKSVADVVARRREKGR